MMICRLLNDNDDDNDDLPIAEYDTSDDESVNNEWKLYYITK